MCSATPCKWVGGMSSTTPCKQSGGVSSTTPCKQCKTNYSKLELARARPHELREFGPAPAPPCIELNARV